MARIQSPKGTFDLLPPAIASLPWQSSYLWSHVEQLLRDLCSSWSIQEMRSPIFEATELFHKSSGASSDIVQKEMYSFEDKGARSMTLRPEGTPGALRALVESAAFDQRQIQKVFYLGPMFRYERPQQGRYRQFHQFGIEVLGPRTPWLDSEVIALGWQLFQRVGLNKVELLINTLASETTRERYRQSLRDYLTRYRDQLSEDSLRRLDSNPLRILDSKDPRDQALLEGAPQLEQMLDDSSRRFFERVLELLEQIGIPYRIEPRLVRGLDYYCDTVFEFQLQGIGAQSAVGGGGRYGRMLADLGGPSLEGVGFAIGMERLVQAILESGNLSLPSQSPTGLLVALGSESAKELFRLAIKGRARGIKLETWPYEDPKKLKQALSYADKLQVTWVSILGDEELKQGTIRIRHMASRQERVVAVEQWLELISR